MQKTGPKEEQKAPRFVSRIIYQNSDDFSKTERSGSGTDRLVGIHIHVRLVINDARSAICSIPARRVFRAPDSLCVAPQGFCAAAEDDDDNYNDDDMQGCRFRGCLTGAAADDFQPDASASHCLPPDAH